jgi:hypothetical protein
MPRFFASGLVACLSGRRYSGGVARRFLTGLALALLLGPIGFALAQPKSAPRTRRLAPASPPPSSPISWSISSPRSRATCSVQDKTLTLSGGRKDGVRPGLELTLFREGREIKHPKTGQVLGKTEENLGRVTVVSVQEQFSQGSAPGGVEIKPGDRFRLSSGKIRLMLLPLSGGVRDNLIEAATQELVERLNSSGRFVVSMGDPINLFIAEQGIKRETSWPVAASDAAQRYKFEHLSFYIQAGPESALHGGSVLLAPATDPVSSSFFVPPSVRQLAERERFSSAAARHQPAPGAGALAAGAVAAATSTPRRTRQRKAASLKEVARLGFAVVAMDIAYSPRTVSHA